ncbi:MAG TPA: hypothetical protein VIV08_04345 [Acidimicrobiia bacterium]|jgi:hypothetical protein
MMTQDPGSLPFGQGRSTLEPYSGSMLRSKVSTPVGVDLSW